MTDDIDRAQAREQELRDDALAVQRRKLVKNAATSAKWCEAPGCGVRIPDARRMAVPGVRRCVSCQQYEEFMGGKR